MASSKATDGPVLSLMNKRLRALRKKYNRILQMEESLAQGKPLNNEQEEVLRSKPAVATLIDEYEKLRQPLSVALGEELSLARGSANEEKTETPPPKEESKQTQMADSDTAVEDLLKLLYFGCLFDVKPQSEFTSTMLTRTHERECCLTYDYVTDDATDLLRERDLDLISMLGGLVIARPVHSSLSHMNALRSCVHHAKLWLANSDELIQPGVSVSYATLRERLNKIMASDYFTTTPEMKAVDVAAAAGKYAPLQAPVQESTVVDVQAEDAFAGQYQHMEQEVANFQGNETTVNEPSSVEESPKNEVETGNPVEEAVSAQQEDQSKADADIEEQNEHGDAEIKEQQYIPRRGGYQNQRGGGRASSGGGRRGGYPNGRGGRGSRGGSNYQNGRSQYYDHGNYYQRNYYNLRGKGGGRSSGSAPIYNNSNNNNPGAAAHGHAPADVEIGRA